MDALLKKLKQFEEDDFAPKLGLVRKTLEMGSSTPTTEIPETWIGKSVTVNGHVWQAEPQGCYGPGGFWLWHSKPQVPPAVLEALRGLYAGPQDPVGVDLPDERQTWHESAFDQPNED